MKRKILVLVSLFVLISVALLGCTPAVTTSTTSQPTGSTTAQTTAAEVQTIQFWYHDGNPTSNPIMEELISRFETLNPNYKVEYVGLPSDSYLQKYTLAVATNTVPDVVSIRDMDVSTFVNQDALISFDEAFASFDQKDNISPAVLDTVRSCAIDGKLYCLPQNITMDISWYNTKLMAEKGITPPTTIDQFLKYCETYADKTNNKYFYSLRGGGGSMENMFDFIFTYANEYQLFDSEGNCVLNQPKFAEALDKYASIYWNGWTSKDSVTNGFKEMVAEFGSGTSMFINHNSSSLAQHKTNLGVGNFMNVLSPANSQGISVTKDMSFVGYGVFKGSKNVEGGIKFAEFMASADAASYLCRTEGRIPVNNLVYAEDWYKSDVNMMVYKGILESPNVRFLTHAIWLTQWNEFRSKYQEPGFQAVLLKEKTSSQVLTEWADYLTQCQKDYLASNK